MIEKKLEIFKALQEILLNNLQRSRAYECLKIMCADTIRELEKGSDELIEFTRWKLKACLDGIEQADSIDSKELQKWIDDNKLNTVIDNVMTAHRSVFERCGYRPIVRKNDTKGGKGNERSYWLDILELVKEIEVDSDQEVDISVIEYTRAPSDSIRISWYFKLFFKNGELKNRSWRGLLLVSSFFLSFIFWMVYLIIVSLVLVVEAKDFNSFNFLIILAVSIVTWMTFKYYWIPIWQLPEYRVIRAPMMTLALSQLEGEIEMYRDSERNQITRFTQFKSTCPICTADIVLKSGYPEHKLPLVGRCVESPFSHVYSFDRVTMMGRKI